MNLKPRLKLKFLLGTIILLVGLSYQLSIRKSIEAFEQYKVNKDTLEKGETAPSDIGNYQQLINNLNNKLGQYAAYDRATLFEVVNTFCQQNQLTLTSFQEPELVSSNDYDLIITPIKVEGKYKDMVQLAYHLEQTQKAGRLANASFEIAKDRQQKREVLRATFLLQNIQAIR